MIETRYTRNSRGPSSWPTTAIVAALVPGPVSRKTRAAPGERPFAISAVATGVDALAQR
jgi:hypothetical protein